MIQKEIREDIKLFVQFKDKQGVVRAPLSAPFVITLFSLDSGGFRSSVWRASYDGKEPVNCSAMGDKLLVTFDYSSTNRGDRGFFMEGKLHCTVFVRYADTQMPDGFYDVPYVVDTQIEIINNDKRR